MRAAKSPVKGGAPAKPGAYEVRLHANYPKQSTNVVFRTRVEVR